MTVLDGNLKSTDIPLLAFTLTVPHGTRVVWLVRAEIEDLLNIHVRRNLLPLPLGAYVICSSLAQTFGEQVPVLKATADTGH